MHIRPYIPTPEDRENDRRLEEWRERLREADRRVLLSRLEAERKARVQKCIDAYAERTGSAA